MTAASANATPGVTVQWSVVAGGGSVTPAISTTDDAGIATTVWTLGTTAGMNQLSASATGLSAVTLDANAVAGPPAQLVLADGDDQVGEVGAALAIPVRVRVTDSYGNARGGTSVAFSAATGSGAFNPTSADTDANGQASAVWTLGTSAGDHAASISVSRTLTVSVAATAHAGPPTTITLESGDAQTGYAGQPLPHPLTISLSDQFGNLVTGAPVTWTTPSGCGTVAPSQGNTDASGLTSAIWTLGASGRACRLAGNGVLALLDAGVGRDSVQFTAQFLGTTADSIHAGNFADQVGTVESGFSLTAYVEDAVENPVPGVTVSFNVIQGSGTLSTAQATTDMDGKATVGFGPGTIAGNHRVEASAPGAGATSFLAWTRAAAPSRLVLVSGDGQSAPVGRPVAEPVRVRLEDAYGNGVYDQPVTFAVTTGGGSVDRTVLRTDTLGYAETGWRPGAVGTNLLTVAWSGQALSVSATGIAHSGYGMTIVSGNEQSLPSDAFVSWRAVSDSAVVRVIDGSGTPVPGVSVIFQDGFEEDTVLTNTDGLAWAWPTIDVYAPLVRYTTARLQSGEQVAFAVIVTGWGGGNIGGSITPVPMSYRAGKRLPNVILISCQGRTGPAPGQCTVRTTNDDMTGGGGTLLPAPGYRPPHEVAYYWILPDQPGVYRLITMPNWNMVIVTAVP